MELSLATTVVLLLHTDFVFTGCSSICTSCSDSTCISCRQLYYAEGRTCLPCPDNCLSCSEENYCTKCIDNKWGVGTTKCTNDCDKVCLNGECQDVTGNCLNCEYGKYGRRCQHNCSDCKNDNCDLYRCVEGCKSGYFEYQTSLVHFCQKCSKNCKECDNGNVCRICEDGFYLNEFYYNSKTHVNCVQCQNENECSNYCFIPDCNQCIIISNRPMCADCPEGETFNGISCEQMTNLCSQGCSTNCDSNGICLGNCSDGFAGERCAERCNEQCLVCSKHARDICMQCNGDFYSNDCSLACNSLCIVSEGKTTCEQGDGYCLNGCIRSHWGETCNSSCPEKCKDHVCDRNNGMCSRGCKDGYTGDGCIHTTIEDQQKPIVRITSAATSTATTTTLVQKQAPEVKIFIIGFSTGIGFSIVIVAIVIFLYFMRRRYLGNKALRNNNRNVEIPTYIETSNNYESLSHNRTMDTVYSDLGTTE